MKGHSQRLTSADPHDDWVDGSWTVDCVCGVNFDDGEEMVNCDECGVWVHTRCSRYVKGDELFTCDKCKQRNNRNDSEETEVAQLLVELPTKPVRIESAYAAGMPTRRPFRLWAEIPMEDRVHVQGIPGGDPSLFNGISSVFTRDLWKSTGYVPKKFTFQYREFPCWDKNERHLVKMDENALSAEKDAGVLFSLSHDKALAPPMTSLCNSKMFVKDAKRLRTEVVDGTRQSDGVKKEKSLLGTVIVHSNKQKKEDSGVSKEKRNRKKVRTEKDRDEKKGGFGASKTVFRSSVDVKDSKSHEPEDPESFRNDIQRPKNKNLKDNVFHGSGESNHAVNGCVEQTNKMAATSHSKEVLPSDCSVGVVRKDVEAVQVPVGPKVSNAICEASILEKMIPNSNCGKEEVVATVVDAAKSNIEGTIEIAGRSIDEDLSVAVGAAVKLISKQVDSVISQDQMKPHEVKNEMDNDDSKGVSVSVVLPPVDAEDPRSRSGKMSEAAVRNTDDMPIILAADDHNVEQSDQPSKMFSNCHASKSDYLPGELCAGKRGQGGPPEGSVLVGKVSSEAKDGTILLNESLKSQRASHSIAVTYTQKKAMSCGKSSISSSAVFKSSSSDNIKPLDSKTLNPCPKKLTVDCSTGSEKNHTSKKEYAASSAVKNKETDDALRKMFKEHAKNSISSKVFHQSRVSHSSNLKKTLSDSKNVSTTSKTSAHDIAGSGDNYGSQYSQSTCQAQIKTSHLGFPPKSEKVSQSSGLGSKDAAQSTNLPVAPSSITTLSDEELALLLHQQLNSSPRVPRVPRVRNSSGFSQQASSASTTSLIKRSSTSVGREHSLVSRRKSKDNFQSYHECDEKVLKAHKVSRYPDQRSSDFEKGVGASTKREETEHPSAVHSVKKNLPPSSTTTTTNSGQCSSNEVNDNNLSSRSSPRDISDDDTGTHRGPVHQTLPGLIDEIMSKGKRMSYEELCSAVLPHWPNLRKHNGERYAYSSHSQAVLDCLRNRHEWARLVDRGPKTNPSKKRRKLDTEESDDSESNKRRTAEEKHLESQREDFPRGKRKARKRRRLSLQGRGITDIRKKRKEEFDDDGPFSDSSEDSSLGEDENQRSASGDKGEGSDSSEDTESE